MTNRFRLLTLAAALITLPLTSVQADVLLVDSIQKLPPNTASGVSRPVTGQSMDSVISQFGEPASRGSAVGDPPITRWNYDGFSVYFEHSHVIHSVVHRPKPAQ